MFKFKLSRCPVPAILIALGVTGGALVRAESPAPPADLIDRQALVSRHNIDWPSLTGEIPLGNGNFAFNADGTGLQTFGGNTMSHWCWHSFPLPAGSTAADVKPWAALESGRLRGVTTPPPKLRDWLYLNPHPLNLGRLGFIDAEGKRIVAADCVAETRHLDLWRGLLVTRFRYRGEIVDVQTCVDMARDVVAVKVVSPALRQGTLRVRLDFPAPAMPGSTDPRRRPTVWVGDFDNDGNHRTEVVDPSPDRLNLKRTIDATTYWVCVSGRGVGQAARPDHANRFDFDSAGQDSVEICCSYSVTPPAASAEATTFDRTRDACVAGWERFWRSGGAIDLSASRDPRWKELERRIVLSQYELAVQSAGDQPPAECGLTGYDPWSGKFHLEMTWWHLAHYALWNRWSMAEKALGYFRRNMPYARAIAQNFSYPGLMWPKSTGPDGINDGYPIEMPLLWKQPHPIYFAELSYRLKPTQETLDQWKDIVSGTAEMMADYPTHDPKTGIYSLDPSFPACEGEIGKDTVFELGYWRWALLTAQTWRERTGMGRAAHWDEVVNHLAPLPVQNGLYVYRPDRTDTYTKRKNDHIDPVGVFAMFPPFPGLDHDTAHRTLLEFAKDWKWDETWGWDFAWMAMGAARMNEPALAVDALLNPSAKNQYDERGLNHFADFPYLPGNGGLLYAVAMMAAGWDGAPDRPAPGFPADGSWTVRWEGLQRAP